MLATILLAAVTVAFPKEGQKIPHLSRCYMIGATDGPESSLVIRVSDGKQQASVVAPVHRTGAWATLIDVKPGTNVVEVGDTRRTFVVEPPKPSEQSKPSKTYTKLEYASDTAKPHPAGRKPSEIAVVIDAGHGGSDPGAVSPHGLPEKDANLRLAKAVEKALKGRGYRVVMTRTDDSFPALYDRPKAAHRENADAFISIHYNAPGYATDPLSTNYHAVYAWNPLGERLAKAINGRMAEAVPSLRNEGVIHANFAVTRNPEIPSCLIETNFITHPDGELAAWDPAARERTARAIAEGFADWAAHP